MTFIDRYSNKQKKLYEEMKKYGLYEKDIEEKFISGSGPGGQKINKSQNAVYLKHIPTKIEVKCQRERSLELNRFLARRNLLEKVKKELFGILTKREKEAKKVKKQKARRARRRKDQDSL